MIQTNYDITKARGRSLSEAIVKSGNKGGARKYRSFQKRQGAEFIIQLPFI